MENKNYGLKWIGQKKTDWVLGDIPHEILNIPFEQYLPAPEVQYDPQFDTFSCASFSITNIVETWLNYYLATNSIYPTLLSKFNTLGVIQGGKFNFSDRFVSIGSGTVPREGNSMQAVIDFVRKNGLVSEASCPFLQTMSQDQFFAPLDPALFPKAKQMKWAINIAYEWTLTDQTRPQDRLSIAQNALQHAPLWCAIPICAYYNQQTPAPTCNLTVPQHCVECYKAPAVFNILDQYNPFLKQLASDYPVLWAMKIVVSLRNPINLPRNLYFGCSGDDVKLLQGFLGIDQTGWFGPATMAKVMEYQSDMGISPIRGFVGPATRASLCK